MGWWKNKSCGGFMTLSSGRKRRRRSRSRGGNINVIDDDDEGSRRQGAAQMSGGPGVTDGQDAVLQVSIDDALSRFVGDFGLGQVVHFTLASMGWTLEAIHTLVTIFADRSPAWKCVNVDTCSRNMCSMDRRSWTWSSSGESTVSQWNLICEESYKKGVVQSAFFVGILMGAGLFGHLSDSRLGRKGALALSCAGSGVVGMLTAAAPNYSIYAALRLLTGVCSGGLGLTSFVLGTECIGPTKRSSVALSSMYFYPVGTVLLAGLAAVSNAAAPYPSWRRLYLIASTPSLLYLLFILPFLAESPRWYLVRGRGEQALRVLKGMARRNGAAPLPGGLLLLLEADLEEVEEAGSGEKKEGGGGGCGQEGVEIEGNAVAETAEKGSLLDVFRRKDTRTNLLMLMVVWFACAVGYFTLNLNVGNLGTNLTMSLVLNAVAEVPGYALTTVMAAGGRRRTLVLSLGVGGASCIAAGATAMTMASKEAGYVRLGGGLLSLMAMAGAYSLLYLYTAELFPTVVRNAALGLVTQAASIASIVSPFAALSSHLSPSLPFFVVGSASVAAACLGACLPNTQAAASFQDTLVCAAASEPPPARCSPTAAGAAEC